MCQVPGIQKRLILNSCLSGAWPLKEAGKYINKEVCMRENEAKGESFRVLRPSGQIEPAFFFYAVFFSCFKIACLFHNLLIKKKSSASVL